MTTLHPHMTFSKTDQISEQNNLIPLLDSEDFLLPQPQGMLLCGLVLATQVPFNILVAEMLASENNSWVCVVGFFYTVTLSIYVHMSRHSLALRPNFLLLTKPCDFPNSLENSDIEKMIVLSVLVTFYKLGKVWCKQKLSVRHLHWLRLLSSTWGWKGAAITSPSPCWMEWFIPY